jgi:hypothetical protein
VLEDNERGDILLLVGAVSDQKILKFSVCCVEESRQNAWVWCEKYTHLPKLKEWTLREAVQAEQDFNGGLTGSGV